MANKLIVTLDADLEALSTDELVALNQSLGADIDTIREYRRKVNTVRHDKQVAKDIAAKLTAEERKALGIVDVTVTPDVVVGSLEAGE